MPDSRVVFSRFFADASLRMERPLDQMSSFRFSDRSQWPRTPLGDWAMRGAARVAREVLRGVECVQEVGLDFGLDLGLERLDAHDPDSVRKWLDRHHWPARPLQLGILEPAGWGAAILEAPGVLRTDWIALSNSDVRCGDIPNALDAVVACFPDGRLSVRTNERLGKPASWFDWANERPRSYPGTFPMRLDCAQVTIHPHTMGHSPDARISRLLIEAAALLSRHVERVDLDDTLDGRVGGGAGARVLGKFAAPDPLVPLMQQIAEVMATWGATDLRSPAGRVASRLMSAWAACGGSGNLHEEASLRRMAVDIAGVVMDDEVETLLRVGAVRLADGDDGVGLEALERATKLLKGTVLQNPPDQVLFILAELQGVRMDPYAIGRVAGGLTLVGATTPRELFPHLRDDILDEMQHTGALIDLEQDQLIVMKTLGMLERVLGVEPRAQRMADDQVNQVSQVNKVNEVMPGAVTWQQTPQSTQRVEQPQEVRLKIPALSAQVTRKKSRAASASKPAKKKSGPATVSKPAPKRRKASATPRITRSSLNQSIPLAGRIQNAPAPRQGTRAIRKAA